MISGYSEAGLKHKALPWRSKSIMMKSEKLVDGPFRSSLRSKLRRGPQEEFVFFTGQGLRPFDLEVQRPRPRYRPGALPRHERKRRKSLVRGRWTPGNP